MQQSREFSPGMRVRISCEYHWAKSQIGTVVAMPRWPRTVSSVKGPLVFYWVAFDVPQFDSDGDGPYGEAEVDSRYLDPLPDE